MKVLITADWHLGKRLYQVDRSADHRHFLQWLIQLIYSEKIDHLIVAGDIFDHANPTHEATKLYYEFLHQLIPTGCRAVITAGNHDSPTFIEVPKDLLAALNIRVIGAFPGLDRIDDIIIPLEDNDGKVQSVLAAVPFLQDRYLRQVNEGDTGKEIREQLRQGLANVFLALGNRTKDLYPNLPRIATAHLFADKVKKGDAERDIQIGMIDGVPKADIDHFDYLGLGHIHSGMVISKDRIKYTGSPISLTFDENQYKHQVTLLEIAKGTITPSYIDVPQLRSLHRLKGDWETVLAEAGKIPDGKPENPDLVEIEVLIKTPDRTVTQQLEELRKQLSGRNLVVAQEKIIVEKKDGGTIPQTHQNAEDLDPVQVFTAMLDAESEEDRQAMLELFQELLANETQQPS